MDSDDFKVIIVGGGPGGLTAAHTLHRAGIDFLLLEGRESPVVDTGSNLVLMCPGMRALSQLGILDEMTKVSYVMGVTPISDIHGRQLGTFRPFTIFRSLLGPPCRVFSRRNLTKVLYDTLPDEVKAKIISSKRVSDVVSTDDGVTVECRDGSSYDGTIVVGADGAHSKVRECLRKLAVKAGSPNINPEKPFLTTYRALWLRFATPDIEGIGAGDATETHGYGISTQLFAGADSGVTGMYERLPEPTRERIRYTQEDQDEMVKRYGHIRLAPKTKSNLTLQEAYDKRLESGIINLEEGVIPHWSWGSRVVLIGDAAHKFTPITGSGCNQSIVDVVALSNELYKAVSEARARSGGKSSRPSPEQLEAAFTAYQERRFTSASAHCMRAGMVSASASWTTRFARFMDLYIMPISFIQRYFYSKGASKEAHMPVLTYVAGKEHWHGTIPWVYPIPTSVETKAY